MTTGPSEDGADLVRRIEALRAREAEQRRQREELGGRDALVCGRTVLILRPFPGVAPERSIVLRSSLAPADNCSGAGEASATSRRGVSATASMTL